jgi:hypothetical protein
MDNHMGLGAAILHCQYTEISINYMGLGAPIPHCQYAEIVVQPFCTVNIQKSVFIIKKNEYRRSNQEWTIQEK